MKRAKKTKRIKNCRKKVYRKQNRTIKNKKMIGGFKTEEAIIKELKDNGHFEMWNGKFGLIIPGRSHTVQYMNFKGKKVNVNEVSSKYRAGVENIAVFKQISSHQQHHSGIQKAVSKSSITKPSTKSALTYEDDLRHQLSSVGSNFRERRCLDIGTRNGSTCSLLLNFGASWVVGIDIDNTRFGEMLPNDNIELRHQDLLVMDPEVDKFDIITCFLWNMPISSYNAIMSKIKSLLTPGGIVYIGIHDYFYKHDQHGGSVPALLGRNFSSVICLDDTNSFQWILEARDPIPDPDP